MRRMVATVMRTGQERPLVSLKEDMFFQGGLVDQELDQGDQAQPAQGCAGIKKAAHNRGRPCGRRDFLDQRKNYALARTYSSVASTISSERVRLTRLANAVISAILSSVLVMLIRTGAEGR